MTEGEFFLENLENYKCSIPGNSTTFFKNNLSRIFKSL